MAGWRHAVMSITFQSHPVKTLAMTIIIHTCKVIASQAQSLRPQLPSLELVIVILSSDVSDSELGVKRKPAHLFPGQQPTTSSHSSVDLGVQAPLLAQSQKSFPLFIYKAQASLLARNPRSVAPLPKHSISQVDTFPLLAHKPVQATRLSTNLTMHSILERPPCCDTGRPMTELLNIYYSKLSTQAIGNYTRLGDNVCASKVTDLSLSEVRRQYCLLCHDQQKCFQWRSMVQAGQMILSGGISVLAHVFKTAF